MVIQRTLLPFAMLLLWSSAATAQTGIEELLPLLERTGEEITPEMVAWLEELLQNRLDLNSATLEELSELPGISPQTAASLYDALVRQEITSAEDLSTVIGADPDLITILRLTTRFDPPMPSPAIRLDVRTDATLEIERARGFRDTLRRIVQDDTVLLGPTYIGPPGGMTSRILGEYDRWRFGVTIDRDPGEPIFYHDTLDFTYSAGERVDRDSAAPYRRESGTGLFASFHMLRSIGPFDLIIGDYTLRTADGLLFGRSFGGRKGGNPVRDPFGGGSGVSPWRSRLESGYFRGGAITLRSDTILGARIGGVGFLSRRCLDGTMSVDESGRPRFSVDDAGLLATRRDLRRNDAIVESVGGARVNAEFGDATFGATFATIHRRSRREPSSRQRESENLPAAGFDVRWRSGGVIGSAETLLIDGEPAATVAVGFGGKEADATISLRHFGSRFHSPYGSPFAESPGNPAGESGIYLGARLRPVRRLTCSFFIDLFRRRSNDRSNPARLYGTDGLSRLTWRPSSATRLEGSGRLKREDEPVIEIDPEGRETSLIAETLTTALRLTLTQEMAEADLKLRIRLERRSRQRGRDSTRIGTLLYLDLGWEGIDNVTLRGGIGLFGGTGSPERVYAHEYTLPGGFGLPSLSGRGLRAYLMGIWQATDRYRLGIRYEMTRYADRDSIRPGSPREIEGSLLSELSLQVGMRFGAHDRLD